jgi:uncharacterized protein (DUF433 family)
VKHPTKGSTITRSSSKHLAKDDPRVSRAIFTLRETAAYLGLSKSTVGRWTHADAGPSLITRLPQRGHEATVPFIGFAEAYVLSSFRKAGVPMQRIRPAVEVLTKEIGVEHALASERLYTDGVEVIFDYATQSDDMELVVLGTKQRQFAAIVKDYLQRITYGGDGWASAVHLPTYANADVVVDPRVAFGLPLVVQGGARVEDLVDRFQAGDTLAELADDFDVPLDQLEDVIRVATKAAT